MRRFFGTKRKESVYIEGEEYNHLKNVLRLNVGDELLVSLNDEYEYACQIQKFEKNSAVCKIIGKEKCIGNPQKNIVIFQAITKRQKFEFIVQKATEIGITRIVPFAMNACKQCERTIMPIIDQPKNVKDVINSFKDFDLVLFANERTDKGEKIKNLDKYKNIAIIVGSEAGFSQKEKESFVEAGATSISLGRRIYRCETASVAMMSLVSILSGN